MPRIFVSVAVTCLLVCVALVAAYVIAMGDQRLDPRRGQYYFYVRDAHLAIGFAGAGVLWLLSMWWIWRGQFGRHFLLTPVITTIVNIGVTIAVCAGIDEFVRREEEYLMFAVVMLAATIACLTWMRYVLGVLQGRAVLSEDRQVNVSCPECGYSLVGLNDLRCPECGATFTIDGLIRAQGYGTSVARHSNAQVQIERPIAAPSRPTSPAPAATD